MTIKRYGTGETGAGKQPLPFARAVEANGWLYVSGQVAMQKGEIAGGGIIAESRKAIENMIAILHEAGYGLEDVVRVGVWLDDPRDFWTFNGIYAEYFGEHPPARACVQSRMMVDCKVEVDCVAVQSRMIVDCKVEVDCVAYKAK
ncbi:reactive intermediate/imine deaminase [Sinorhizobium medicae]|nr:reactive intermediate/imine deaminase [Sinorhizobium medicae]